MPPKKEKKLEPLVEYDVNTMNTPELKQYAKMLETEIEATRNRISFYQQTEDSLANVYKIRQDQIQQMEDEVVGKDIELEKLQLEMQQKLEEKMQHAMYRDYVNEKRIQLQESQSRLDGISRLKQQEQEQLKTRLQNMEDKFKAESTKIQMARKETMEKNCQKLKNMDDDERNLREKSMKVFDEKLAESSQQYRLAMISVEAEALEGKRRSENEFRDTCQSYKQKLKEYYQGITREDLDVIKELTQKARDLENSIHKTKLRIRSVQQENAELKSGHPQKNYPRYEPGQLECDHKASKVKNSSKNRKIEQLRNENQVLESKVKALEEKTDNLRDQFTQTLYKVRQSAEIKVELLEKKFNSSSTDSEDETSEKSASEDEEEIENEDLEMFD